MHFEGLRTESRLAVQRIEAIGEARRPDHADASGPLEVVAEIVSERDEIHEVIGMEVRDQHGAQRRRLDRRCKSRKRPLAKVQEERIGARSDEVGSPRRSDPISERGSCTEHVESERVGLVALSGRIHRPRLAG